LPTMLRPNLSRAHTMSTSKEPFLASNLVGHL
jgi:hypothetical protein